MLKILKKLIIHLLIFIDIISDLYQNLCQNYRYQIKPKISIFLPIYNKELYLKEGIKSLQKQTFKNIEIIGVNDGSTDNSLKILKKLSKKDKRIKIINNDRNHGLLYSRAMGISNSSGEYLMNLDPDDKLVSKYDLHSLNIIAKKKKYDTIIFLIKRIPVNKSDTEFFKYLDENQLKLEDYYITNKFVKKETFIKAFQEFKDEIFDKHWNYHEDNIWNYLVRKNSNSIKILKKYIYSYKRNQDSLNIKKGNDMYMKNQYDRIKKFKSLDYININSLEFHLKIDFQDYNKLKNYELKNHIFHTLINYMIFFTNKTIIYKKINLVLNKLSEKKLILFYNCTNIKNLDAAFLTTFKALISSHKYIVPIFLNVSDKIKEINDFIFPSDTLIFLNNLFLNNQLYNFFDSHKKNNIIAFVNKKDNLSQYKDYKNLSFFLK